MGKRKVDIYEPSEYRQGLLKDKNIRYFYSEEDYLIHHKNCRCTRSIPDSELKTSTGYIEGMPICDMCFVDIFTGLGCSDTTVLWKKSSNYLSKGMTKSEFRKLYLGKYSEKQPEEGDVIEVVTVVKPKKAATSKQVKYTPSMFRHKLLSDEHVYYFMSEEDNILHHKTCVHARDIPDDKLIYSDEIPEGRTICKDCFHMALISKGARDGANIKAYEAMFKRMKISRQNIEKLYSGGKETMLMVNGIIVFAGNLSFKIVQDTEAHKVSIYRCESYGDKYSTGYRAEKNHKGVNGNTAVKYICKVIERDDSGMSPSKEEILEDDSVEYVCSSKTNVIHSKYCKEVLSMADEDMVRVSEFDRSRRFCSHCFGDIALRFIAEDYHNKDLYLRFFNRVDMCTGWYVYMYDNKMKTEITDEGLYITCKEDSWLVTPSADSKVNLYHNNYLFLETGGRQFVSGYHLQREESMQFNAALNCIARYSFDPSTAEVHRKGYVPEPVDSGKASSWIERMWKKVINWFRGMF